MLLRTRTGRFGLVGIALAIGATLLPTSAAARSTAPPALRLAGDGLSAVIRYTEYGIPHVLAKDYAGLGFGTGWAQAADQVCVLADGFLTVRGERSLHFGPEADSDDSLSAAASNLSSDLYFRGVRDSRTVEQLLATPAPRGPSRASKELMRGWAAGYNAWLKQRQITDPACQNAAWVRPVSALDVARRNHALAVLGGQGRLVDSITSAQPPQRVGGPATVPVPTAAAEAARRLFSDESTRSAEMGSNAVAFSGNTTADGRGLLLGNPHYPWHGGRRFWQVQQTIPGVLNVSGGALLGTTVVNIGFNEKMAWSHTVSTGVPMNLHQLVLDPADPTVYVVDGLRERMRQRTVTVEVKGASPVTRTQWWTRYGPVITSLGPTLPLPWSTNVAYALHDPNASNLRLPDSALALGASRSTGEALRALRRTQGLPWVNTIAADSRGGTLFTQSQVLPRMTDELVTQCSTPLGQAMYPASGMAVLDGSRNACALGSDQDAVQPGILGPSRMPTLVNAPYAANSNDSAWLANANQPLTGYERIFGTVGTPRSLRTRGGIEDVSAMAARGSLTVADLQRQQFANRVPVADLAITDVVRACPAALPDDTEACRALANWDRTVGADSRGALLFDRFWRRLSAQSAATLWRTPFSVTDPVGTPRTVNTQSALFGQALTAAVAELRQAGIALDAPLGRHQFVVRNGERIAVHGGTESLGVWNKVEARWDPAGGGYAEVAMGSSHIQAVGWDGGRCPVARTSLTYSQSSNPLSPHYQDQTKLYAAGKWVTSRFCEKDILSSPALRVVQVRER
ncbi:penicillin acylase family protein [Streptomyces sp. NBC_00690]|uniref:penicillin acylase family protein n=1 Tax=Streptomyces sp. NBC_00690 TaxID=2975808 RepID=UPI002E2E4659|nr:penicillin acylase family protein [Streptomyces sp. NBC_00690]